MHVITRLAVGVSLALLTIACNDPVSVPTAPTRSTAAPAAPAGPVLGVPPGFPAVSRPARIYVAVNWPSYAMHGSPLASQYVLYDDGTFALQYSSANYPFFEYRGTYKEANALITFEWEGWSTAGPWGATGSLSDDSLSVRYNLIMQLSDFEDGIYIRAR
jgi:hypothetical protein